MAKGCEGAAGGGGATTMAGLDQSDCDGLPIYRAPGGSAIAQQLIKVDVKLSHTIRAYDVQYTVRNAGRRPSSLQPERPTSPQTDRQTNSDSHSSNSPSRTQRLLQCAWIKCCLHVPAAMPAPSFLPTVLSPAFALPPLQTNNALQDDSLPRRTHDCHKL